MVLPPQTRNITPHLLLSKEAYPLPTILVAPLMQLLHPHHHPTIPPLILYMTIIIGRGMSHRINSTHRGTQRHQVILVMFMVLGALLLVLGHRMRELMMMMMMEMRVMTRVLAPSLKPFFRVEDTTQFGLREVLCLWSPSVLLVYICILSLISFFFLLL